MAHEVSEVTPSEAWDALREDPKAVLVDVRTNAEWSFVGVPDVSELGKQAILVEWARLPGMQQNPDFLDGVMSHLDGAVPSKVFFLCRSGARSLSAAHLCAQAFAAKGDAVECVNVAEGFEGDLNRDRHRGNTNGWKARGLSWRQS